MDLEALEKEAHAAAAKHVANLLQRPDQLEKLEQYKRRVMRKKVTNYNHITTELTSAPPQASVDGMLKTAMQTQLGTCLCYGERM